MDNVRLIKNRTFRKIEPLIDKVKPLNNGFTLSIFLKISGYLKSILIKLLIRLSEKFLANN